MRKEFESELARQVSGKKRLSRAWVMLALCAAILVSGAAAVTAVAAGNGDQLQTQDQLKDGSCDDCDGDGICDYDLDGDGVCDNDCTCDCDGDGICDNDSDGDGVCDYQEDCVA